MNKLPSHKWDKRKLGTLAQSIRELYEPNQDEALPYIGLEHIEQDTLCLNGIGNSSDTVSTKKVFKAGDILFGSLRPYFRKVVKPKFSGVCSTDVTVIRAIDDCVAEFLFYFIANRPFIDLATNISSGTRMPRANWDTLSSSEWMIPIPRIQNKIGTILSAYDNLIENNTRRIKILEGMAQSIYREWFVNFRFPGHENLHVTSYKPDGWIVSNIGDACNEFLDGDWIETKDQGGEDYRLLQISNIGMNDFRETGNYRFVTEETFQRLHCNEVIPGDILISRMPDPIGRAWYVFQQPWKMITAIDVTIARPNMDIVDPFYYLYHLNSPQNLQRCIGGATGTTRPRISRSHLATLPILIPQLPLQQKFGRIAKSLHDMKVTLTRQMDKLSITRDLLLPRLISGELDMSDLDIDINDIVGGSS